MKAWAAGNRRPPPDPHLRCDKDVARDQSDNVDGLREQRNG